VSREQLLERQYQLLSCLVAGGPDPQGMAARRLRLVARGLAFKRRREALSSWPGLAVLSGQLEGWFDQYAAAHQRPAGGSPLLDGYHFCEWLAERGISAAVNIVVHCRPAGEWMVDRPLWQRAWVRLRYTAASWRRRQYPEYTLKSSLPALS
jgi:hypothetical protein